MNTHQLLGGLLVAQVAVGIAMWWPTDDGPQQAIRLIDVERDAISSITIVRKPAEDAEEEPVVLERRGETWVQSSTADYPAMSNKVNDVLDALVDMEVRSPIATKSSSHNQLKVGTEEYSKRVDVVAGDQTWTFWMGAAASNTSHVRMDGAAEVYAVNVSAWTVSDNKRNYWDAQYIQLDKDALSSLTVTNDAGTLSFVRNDAAWDLLEIPEGAVVDQTEVDSFIRKATSVRMNEPVSATSNPAHGLDTATVVKWEIEEGDQTTGDSYDIGNDEDNFTFVRSQASGFVVKVSKSSIATLKEATIQDFLKDSDEG